MARLLVPPSSPTARIIAVRYAQDLDLCELGSKLIASGTVVSDSSPLEQQEDGGIAGVISDVR